MPKTHRLCRNNPLIPFAARPGSEPCVLVYPSDLSTAKHILLSISKTMVRQCATCHRFITGAPSPELGHEDGIAGPNCVLPHHPLPCPWVDRNGQPCSQLQLPSVLPLATQAASHTSTSSEAQGGAPGGDQTVLQQLEAMRREKEEQARRLEQLSIANANLRSNQSILSQELSKHSGITPSSIFFTSTTTTTTFSSFSGRPLMGTGYSTSFGMSTSSSGVSVAGNLASSVGPMARPSGYGANLASAASALSQMNAHSQASSLPQTLQGYGGPTIPDLRNNAEVSDITQQVLQNILHLVPALAPQMSAVPGSAGPVSAQLQPPLAAVTVPPSSVMPPPAPVFSSVSAVPLLAQQHPPPAAGVAPSSQSVLLPPPAGALHSFYPVYLPARLQAPI